MWTLISPRAGGMSMGMPERPLRDAAPAQHLLCKRERRVDLQGRKRNGEDIRRDK